MTNEIAKVEPQHTTGPDPDTSNDPTLPRIAVVDPEKGKKDDDLEEGSEKKAKALEVEGPIKTDEPATEDKVKKPFTWKGYWEETFVKDKWFWLIIVVLLLVNIGIHRWTPVGIWFGFLLSSYGAIANDSIQTLGTFIASNTGIVAWWKQWIWIALIFNGTTIYSWVAYDGDITHERLKSKGFDIAPTSLN
jgi:hypothetical protein